MPIQSVCVYGTRVVDSTSMNKTLRLLKKVQKIEDVCDDPKRTMLTRPVTNVFFFQSRGLATLIFIHEEGA
jgi:hypothetical protein